MDTKSILLRNLQMGTQATLSLIEDMKEAPLTYPTSNGGCHPLWILGHLVYSEGGLVHSFILGKDNPNKDWEEIFNNGTDAKDDPNLYPSMDEILARFDVTRKMTLEVFDSLTEADMERESHAPEELKEIFPTVAACLMMSGAHWWSHRGQVVDSRKSLGRERLGF